MPNKSMPEDPEELRLLYGVTVSDLTYFKTQQWSVTNYVFLLLAAVAYLRQEIGKPILIAELAALTLLVATVVTVGLTILSKLQHSVVARQRRLEATRKTFGSAFNEAWAAGDKGREKVHSIWFLRAAVVLGGLIDLWLVFR